MPLADYRRRFKQDWANLTVLRWGSREEGPMLELGNDEAHTKGIRGATVAMSKATLALTGFDLTLEDVEAVARGRVEATLDSSLRASGCWPAVRVIEELLRPTPPSTASPPGSALSPRSELLRPTRRDSRRTCSSAMPWGSAHSMAATRSGQCCCFVPMHWPAARAAAGRRSSSACSTSCAWVSTPQYRSKGRSAPPAISLRWPTWRCRSSGAGKPRSTADGCPAPTRSLFAGLHR